MASNWRTNRLDEIIEINPTETIKKGTKAKKIGMEILQPYCRDIPNFEVSEYNGGTKFRNGDTIMARITPCLENGKIAMINVLEANEIGFGSTEYIVFRAKENITTPDFVYYLVCSPIVKETAIKSMVGSSGRQRVQTDVIKNMDIPLPPFSVQKKIGEILKNFDDIIESNRKANEVLQNQAFAIFDKIISNSQSEKIPLSEIAELNPKRTIAKNTEARCIDMSLLSTSGSFPNGWETKAFNGGMRFQNGDTLLARITPCLENGKTAFIDFLDENEVAFGSTEYIVLCSMGEYPPQFFYCLARYPEFVEYAVKNMNGSSGRQRVSADIIGKYEIPNLTADEIKEFSEVVPPMFEVMRSNSLENIKLAQLRDTLLPKLISGELDVSEVNI